MGGKLENVEVIKANAPGCEAKVVMSFANFDAANAQCFDPKDKVGLCASASWWHRLMSDASILS